MTSIETKSVYQAVNTDTKEMLSAEAEVVVTKRRYLVIGAFACFFLGAIFMVMIGAGSNNDQGLRLNSSKAFLAGTCPPCSFAQCKVPFFGLLFPCTVLNHLNYDIISPIKFDTFFLTNHILHCPVLHNDTMSLSLSLYLSRRRISVMHRWYRMYAPVVRRTMAVLLMKMHG